MNSWVATWIATFPGWFKTFSGLVQVLASGWLESSFSSCCDYIVFRFLLRAFMYRWSELLLLTDKNIYYSGIAPTIILFGFVWRTHPFVLSLPPSPLRFSCAAGGVPCQPGVLQHLPSHWDHVRGGRTDPGVYMGGEPGDAPNGGQRGHFVPVARRGLARRGVGAASGPRRKQVKPRKC